ncbi:MAG: hypothetical protein HY719_00730 [Planctomycetes bacterium]|nr:hypothetical protein [Planctomycetota bacterium]
MPVMYRDDIEVAFTWVQRPLAGSGRQAWFARVFHEDVEEDEVTGSPHLVRQYLDREPEIVGLPDDWAAAGWTLPSDPDTTAKFRLP